MLHQPISDLATVAVAFGKLDGKITLVAVVHQKTAAKAGREVSN